MISIKLKAERVERVELAGRDDFQY